MSKLTKSQICPYCKHEVDDALAEWEEGHHFVTCSQCGKDYIVITRYRFEGFETGKECDWCGDIVHEFCSPHCIRPSSKQSESPWMQETVWVARDKAGNISRASDTSPSELLQLAEELKEKSK